MHPHSSFAGERRVREASDPGPSAEPGIHASLRACEGSGPGIASRTRFFALCERKTWAPNRQCGGGVSFVGGASLDRIGRGSRRGTSPPIDG